MFSTAESLWEASLNSLRAMLKPEIFDLWFAPLCPRSFVGDLLVLEVGDEFTQMWICDNYLDLLRSVVSKTAIQPIQIQFVVVPRTPTPEVRAVPMPAASVVGSPQEEIVSDSPCHRT